MVQSLFCGVRALDIYLYIQRNEISGILHAAGVFICIFTLIDMLAYTIQLLKFLTGPL